eukprot:366366-Chlamydomonas_euryale.AAC.33
MHSTTKFTGGAHVGGRREARAIRGGCVGKRVESAHGAHSALPAFPAVGIARAVRRSAQSATAAAPKKKFVSMVCKGQVPKGSEMSYFSHLPKPSIEARVAQQQQQQQLRVLHKERFQVILNQLCTTPSSAHHQHM